MKPINIMKNFGLFLNLLKPQEKLFIEKIKKYYYMKIILAIYLYSNKSTY